MRALGCQVRQRTGRWDNDGAENSHLAFRRRERAMLGFRRRRSPLMFAAVHASVHNHVNRGRSLCRRDHVKTNRAAALAEWRGLLAARILTGRANRDWFDLV